MWSKKVVLSKIFEALYVKVLVNIIIQKTKTLIYIEVYGKKGIIEHIHNEFDATEPTQEMVEFISSYTKETPYFYIAYLDPSNTQGVIPTCNKNRLSYYKDISSCEHLCFENRWTFYTSKSELYELEKTQELLGVDFIFSPFVVLANFFQDKISSSVSLYILILEESIALSVFEDSELLYGEYLVVKPTNDDEETFSHEDDDVIEMEDALDESIDLEDIDVDDNIESLEDFGDIEDLDSIEEIEDFSDNRDIEEELQESEMELEDGDEEHFNQDYNRFALIEESVANYYKDDRYESKFLENIYIADSVGVSRDLKKLLEEEMFFNVYIRHIDIGVEVSEISKKELGL